MDSQQVEIVGRSLLVTSLVGAGVEVAEPARDRGIDLIAYDDRHKGGFRATPIQLKASSARSLSINRKYEDFPGLRMVFVWGCSLTESAEIFALTWSEIVEVAEVLGWTRTRSWIDKGAYMTSTPSKSVLETIEIYRVRDGEWPDRLGWRVPHRLAKVA